MREVNKRIQIKKIGSLREVLISKGVQIDTWGKIRTLDHLFSELMNNESYLTEDSTKIIRNIEVVCLEIRHTNKILLQYKQIFQTGEGNEILKLPSEKMLVGETIKEACTRLLKEELNIIGDLEFKYIEEKHEVSPAFAYPGIFNSLNLHYYETVLSSDINMLDSYEEVTNKQTTYFKWFDNSFLNKISI